MWTSRVEGSPSSSRESLRCLRLGTSTLQPAAIVLFISAPTASVLDACSSSLSTAISEKPSNEAISMHRPTTQVVRWGQLPQSDANNMHMQAKNAPSSETVRRRLPRACVDGRDAAQLDGGRAEVCSPYLFWCGFPPSSSGLVFASVRANLPTVSPGRRTFDGAKPQRGRGQRNSPSMQPLWNCTRSRTRHMVAGTSSDHFSRLTTSQSDLPSISPRHRDYLKASPGALDAQSPCRRSNWPRPVGC